MTEMLNLKKTTAALALVATLAGCGQTAVTTAVAPEAVTPAVSAETLTAQPAEAQAVEQATVRTGKTYSILRGSAAAPRPDISWNELQAKLTIGDKIIAYRNNGPVWFWHKGIYVGNGLVVSKWGNDDLDHNGQKKNGRIECNTLADFVGPSRRDNVHIENAPMAFDRQTIANRALSKQGFVEPWNFNSNCGHFANWCQTNRWFDDQVGWVFNWYMVSASPQFLAYQYKAPSVYKRSGYGR
jgi:hypothetical protein